MNDELRVYYWDASAILSALVKDTHSEAAKQVVDEPAYHFISSLAYSEVCAVISRLQREKMLSKI